MHDLCQSRYATAYSVQHYMIQYYDVINYIILCYIILHSTKLQYSILWYFILFYSFSLSQYSDYLILLFYFLSSLLSFINSPHPIPIFDLSLTFPPPLMRCTQPRTEIRTQTDRLPHFDIAYNYVYAKTYTHLAFTLYYIK